MIFIPELNPLDGAGIKIHIDFVIVDKMLITELPEGSPFSPAFVLGRYFFRVGKYQRTVEWFSGPFIVNMLDTPLVAYPIISEIGVVQNLEQTNQFFVGYMSRYGIGYARIPVECSIRTILSVFTGYGSNDKTSIRILKQYGSRRHCSISA